MKTRNLFPALLVAALAMIAAVPSAMAVAIDVTPVTDQLTLGLAAVTTVGGAVLGVIGLVAVFKFIRRAV